MRLLKSIVGAASLFFVCCLPSLAQLPDPSESEYFNTSRAGVVIDPATQPPEITYFLVLQPKLEIPAGAIAVIEFENPADSDRPLRDVLRLDQPITASDRLITLRSPNLECITNDRNYRLSVTLFADAQQRQILDTYEQMIYFTAPEAQLQQVGVVQCSSS